MSHGPRGPRPIVAIVGRPNVGKSRLFNRLLGRARSIVDDLPGVTRDRIYAEAVLDGPEDSLDVVLVDTGGFDVTGGGIARRVLEQTQLAIDEADLIVFVTDARAGVLPDDEEIARRLRRGAKSVILAVNKVDGAGQEPLASDFHRFGFDSTIAVSAAHGRHVGELASLAAERLAKDFRPYSAPAMAAARAGPAAAPRSLLEAAGPPGEDDGPGSDDPKVEGCDYADVDPDPDADADADADRRGAVDGGVNGDGDSFGAVDAVDGADSDGPGDVDVEGSVDPGGDVDSPGEVDDDGPGPGAVDVRGRRVAVGTVRRGPAPVDSSEDASEGARPLGPVRVAVIGRPNSGKSSLINRLLGEDRHLVSEVAGTTVDSVDSAIAHRGRSYVFIDTAGIRRKRSIALRLERFSIVAALKGLGRADVALLLIDATQPVAAQDAKVAAFAYEKGKAVVLVVSKWDVGRKGGGERSHVEMLRQELPHLAYAPIVFTSAHTGMGVDRLFPTIEKVQAAYGHRVSTGQLNRLMEALTLRHPPPSKKGRRGRIYYLTQIDVRPPRILVSVNDPELFHYSYRRFLVNELRRAYGFGGSPVLVGYRSHKVSRAEPRKPKQERPTEKGVAERARSTTKQATAARRARKKAKGAR